jgi:hypothetical protein
VRTAAAGTLTLMDPEFGEIQGTVQFSGPATATFTLAKAGSGSQNGKLTRAKPAPAFAPASLSGNALAVKVSGATGGYPAKGGFQQYLAPTGYLADGDGAPTLDQGTYTYQAFTPALAVLTLHDLTRGDLTEFLTFNSPTKAAYLLSDPTVQGSQRGTVTISRNKSVVLLHDTFKPSSPITNATNVNFDLPARQSGTLSTITYTKAAEPVFSQINEVGASGILLLACRAAGSPGEVSLDHNFTATPGVGNAFVIQFDVNPVFVGPGVNETQTSWVCIDVGSTAAGRNQFPQYTDGIGLLFRGTGETQANDRGTLLTSTNFAPGVDDLYHHIRLELFDPLGKNPFDGGNHPVVIRAFADGSATPFFSYTRPTAFTSNYLSFVGEGEGGGGDGVVRHGVANLDISIQPVA